MLYLKHVVCLCMGVCVCKLPFNVMKTCDIAWQKLKWIITRSIFGCGNLFRPEKETWDPDMMKKMHNHSRKQQNIKLWKKALFIFNKILSTTWCEKFTYFMFVIVELIFKSNEGKSLMLSETQKSVTIKFGENSPKFKSVDHCQF